MARSTLPYALALVGLLATAPLSEAANRDLGQNTVAEYLMYTHEQQIFYLSGALELNALLQATTCRKTYTVGAVQDVLRVSARIGRLPLTTNLMVAVYGLMVTEFGCAATSQTNGPTT